ncbi:hypothetical protein M569_11653 [Genlisea aurea]|uniref:C2H2-type domain-containing protein n=1 Tax=Genlisea aurea TaxID=192259 RepID=S8DJS5_9LAMI|nr:hypothetical protein M569_11653 [Genlisea aurea]
MAAQHQRDSSKWTNRLLCSGSLCNNAATAETVSNGHPPPPSFPAKLSGCYECRTAAGTGRDHSAVLLHCRRCGKIFTKPDDLELHRAVSHAVTELGPQDTSKHIVEIIFRSSWLDRKQGPVCRIHRILKIHNTSRTIRKFEEYRETIKARAARKHPRCLADGNELLRFHCTNVKCSLGLNASSNLCTSSSSSSIIPSCSVCAVIKHGFRVVSQSSCKGILTTATSGRAHDKCRGEEGGPRAMLVCRVIAGRVKSHPEENSDDYDSVKGAGCSNLDELYVFNPRAIFPCFVVIYTGL